MSAPQLPKRRQVRRSEQPATVGERAWLRALHEAANEHGHLSEADYERLCTDSRFADVRAERRLTLLLASSITPVWEID